MKSVLVIAGPTASGKSGIALRLARTFGGVVINADSMQVYRELRVLTARPDPADEAAVPHRLYGVLPAAEPCSVARWLDMAIAEIRAAWAAGRVPIAVGGTGLYLRALTEGLSPLPDIPEPVRAAARALHAEIGGAALRARLAEIDPETAARLPDGDSQRLLRAWEVARATGRPLPEWQRDTPPVPPLPDARYLSILLAPPRADLYAACDARFRAMLDAGGLTEASALAALGLDPALPAMKAVGVPQLLAHLRGETPIEAAIEAAQRATRQYAKRQTTWFRHQMRPDLRIEAFPGPREADGLARHAAGFLGDAFPPGENSS